MYNCLLTSLFLGMQLCLKPELAEVLSIFYCFSLRVLGIMCDSFSFTDEEKGMLRQ